VTDQNVLSTFCLLTPTGLVALEQSTDIAPPFPISSHIPEPEIYLLFETLLDDSHCPPRCYSKVGYRGPFLANALGNIQGRTSKTRPFG
jgi:hypothetical protein